jgi:hypothetical protein
MRARIGPAFVLGSFLPCTGNKIQALTNCVDKRLPTLWESSLSDISRISPTTAPPPVPKTRSVDADGENDGTKATEKTPAPPAPQVSKPTETKGNHVNTTA